MRKKQTYNLVLTSVFASIIVLLSLIPQIGFITILPGVSITLVHIPVLIGIMFLPFNYSAMLGLFFGLGSWIASFLYAKTPFDFAFHNPLISVVPRILFAVAAFGVGRGFIWFSKKVKFSKPIIVGFVTLISGVALVFGSRAIVNNYSFSKHSKTAELYGSLSGVIAAIEDDETILEERAFVLDLEELVKEKEIKVEDYLAADLLTELNNYKLEVEGRFPALEAEAKAKNAKINKVVLPLTIVLSIGIGVFYVLYTRNKESLGFVAPATFIIGTVIHTVLVLAFVMLFASKEVFAGTFGDAVQFIYAIAMSNGLIEALAAVLIGTPIFIGLSNLEGN